MNDHAAGASPVDQPVGQPCPKRYEGGRIKGGCSLHDAEKPELCQKHLHRCPEPRTVDCCGAVDEHDIVECHRCGKQWTVPCNFDGDYSRRTGGWLRTSPRTGSPPGSTWPAK